ncbi:MAG: hypothetical protein JRI34_11280, partial [Deltaproteobacteria bacterium]|nr:hypothetical protein [Deltaproteobacteria bacterium]
NFPGLVATSDSVLIDRTKEPFDLAGHLIKEHIPDVKIKILRQHQDETNHGNTN